MSVAYPDAKLTYLDTFVISSCPKLEVCTSRTKKNNKRLVAYSLRIILSIIKSCLDLPKNKKGVQLLQGKLFLFYFVV